eukprot:Nitzschia sp. Nitz4//scaffold8_size234185//5292//6134//NITZ4_001226-RA/size234185-processed-gene-0.142-mRNA-1//-1//CDS//3329559713//7220//frame0
MSQAKMVEVAIGKKYKAKFEGGKAQEFLDDNEALQQRVKNNKWIRWDGVEGTAEEHGQHVLERLRYLSSPERDSEFRYYGTKAGCTYYIHDEETKAANGYGLFKVEAVLKVEPKDLLAFVFDMEQVGEADETVVLNKVLAMYRGKAVGDPFSAVVYWANYPGFPFYIRDGIDLTTYHKDDDGTMWQMSTSLTGGDYFQSMPGGMAATDRIFGYKLVPSGDGTTKVAMFTQTALYGWIPITLSNWMVCGVLIDYMKTIEEGVAKAKEAGTHQKLLEQLELA